MKNLSNKVAVITGAASGIGRALCVELAGQGVDIALCDTDTEGLLTTQQEILSLGRKASIHQIDVSDRKAMEALPEQVLAEHEHVHILINNAGVSFMDTVEHASVEDFEWIFAINFWGVLYGSKFFLPHLLKEEESHLVNISSVYGLIGVPCQAGYCATKFAVRGFTESLRQEMLGRSLGVTSVHPGGVDTNIARSSRFTQGFDVGSSEELATYFKRVAITSPERAAQTIIKGIRKKHPRVIVGRDARFLDRVQRLFPILYPKFISWVTPKPR
ncbi:MAG: SDR family oxidoreductase [Porticoccaceae bacterium]|nr:SDR family oxidoreductase [Porticoccaceae bacterium]